MELDTFIQRVQSSPGYQSNADARKVADPLLEQMRNLSRLPHAPAAEKRELHKLLGTLQQKLARVLIPQTAADLSWEEAREIMGEGKFFGPDSLDAMVPDWSKTMTFPPLPPREEIEAHAKRGDRLRLRVNRAPDGSPLTMQKMQELLQDKFSEDEDAGDILADTSWYEQEEFFTKDVPAACWAFTSGELLPDSTDKNYLQQTDLLADYVSKTLFKGKPVPPQYQEALDEFKKQRKEIERLMDSNWQEAAKRLESLKLNQLLRHSPSEALYDFLQTYCSTQERTLENDWTWTNKRSSDGRLVRFGGCDSGGAYVDRDPPGRSHGGLGVALSRKFL